MEKIYPNELRFRIFAKNYSHNTALLNSFIYFLDESTLLCFLHRWNMIHLIIDIPWRTSLWLYSWYPHLRRAFSQGWPTLKFLPISIFVAFNAIHMPLFLFLPLLFSLSVFPFLKFQPFYKQIPKTIEGATKIR